MLIRIFVLIAAVVFFNAASLRSAEEVTVVWTATSIGPAYTQFQTLACAAEPTSCPVFSLTGAGGLTSQEDVYAFTYRTLRGDGYLVGRVSEITGMSSALAGLSIRASLSPGAAQLSLLQTASGGLVVRKRIRAGVSVYQSNIAAVTGSAWLKLERRGQTISLAQSADGSQWASIPGATIDLPETAYAGLVVNSQRPDGMATATMSGVRLVPTAALPDGWTKADLEGTGVESQAEYASAVWTLSQWPTSTASTGVVSFLYQRVSGDAEISVRLAESSSSDAIAGLQIRSTLDSDSPYVWLGTSPRGERSIHRRQAAGLPSTVSAIGAGLVPGWLKLVRRGAMVSAYQSSNGMYWTLLTTESVELSDSVYVGLALAAGTNNPAAAVFDDVHLNATAANELPAVSLTWPSSGTSVIEGEAVRIVSDASDSDDRVEVVEFFVDATPLGADTAAPYLASWLATGVGDHQLTALVRDSDGAIVTTPPILITVRAREDYGEPAPVPPPSDPVPPRGTEPTSPPSSPTAGTWRLLFSPSVDHNDLVDRYTAEIFSLNQSALVGARDLGRPPVVAGECNVDLSEWISALPPGEYQIVVHAVNDSAAAQSAGASFSFVR